jgi:hypothetical protein
MVAAGSVFGSLAGLPHFPMSFTSISADLGPSIVTGAFFVPLMILYVSLEFH